MLAANIIAPHGVLCGACNIIVTLFEPVELFSNENIKISGDVKDVLYTVSGEDRSWVLKFSFPDAGLGNMTIALLGDVTTKKENRRVPLEQVSLDVAYDTCHVIPARWGDVVYDKNKVILPIVFEQKIIGLTTDYFSIHTGVYDLKPQLYGIGDTGTVYQLEFDVRNMPDGKIRVALDKEIVKENGNMARVQIAPITIRYPEIE